MQAIAGWDTLAEVTTPVAQVSVDGKTVEVDSVEITRELASSMPGTVIGGGGLTAATGPVDWSQVESVEVRPKTPWAPQSGMPPEGGARVLVDVGTAEAGTCRLLTGRVDTSDGALSDGVLSSVLVDDVDRLNRPVTFDPLLSSMPPLTSGGAPRQVRMNGVWVVDAILRRCGYYATPRRQPGTVIAATCQGSMWPEVGTVTACSNTGGDLFPQFASAPWGVCVQDVDATYAPNVARTLSDPLEIMLSWPGSGTGNPDLRVYFGTHSVRLALTPSLVVAHVFNGGTPTLVASAARGTATRAVARFTPSGSTLNVEVRTDAGAVGTGSTTAPSGLLSTAMTRARIRTLTTTGRAGAFAVAFPPSRSFADLAHVPTTLFDIGSVALYTLLALPSIIGRDALDVLKEHAAAVGAAMWLDEQGRVRWVGRDRLGIGSPVRTLTSRDDLLDAAWSAEWRDMASQVDVAWSRPALTRALQDKVTVWEGGGGGLDSGDVYEDIIHPGAGEDWIMVDTSVTALGPSANMDAFNLGVGSFHGASMVYVDTDAVYWAPAATVDSVVEKVDARTYIVTTTVGDVPSGTEVSSKAPAATGLGIYTSRYGDPLPVIRARARFELTTATATAAQQGPPEAAALSHDAGVWVQYEDQAQGLADWIAETATVHTPQLRDVSVTFDPRLQLGDVVQIDDPDRSGLSVRGVVFKITNTVGQADASTRLTVRVLSVTILNPTLAEYDAAWDGATLAERDAQWAGLTLGDFDANPTLRS